MKIATKLAAGTALALLTMTAAAQAKTLRLNHNNPEDHPVHISMQKMADEVEEATGGDLKIRIYANGQLGTQRESTEQVQNCSLDMARSNAAELEAFVPSYAVFNLPYMFASEDHFNQVIAGDIGKEILDSGIENGIRGLAYYTEGARSFYTNKAINSPADLEGMKIRVQPSPSAVRMVELLGGNPTPIGWGELYSALQQGVVDGAENNPTALTTARHGEVAKHFSLDEHTLIPSVVFISNCAWDGLSTEEQEALATAAHNSMLSHTEAWKLASDAAIEEAQAEMGVEIHEVDKAPFIEAVQPMYQEAEEANPELAGLIEQIRASAQ
ncbi:TRAP transporter substrate-binding protein [Paracoccus homiensis]|uniref:Tripartite ATP-independent transporter solute receptor, DctP family n=1 Tax=Paracoccus homiensis TaxID=364199 RepID=A0A1I0DMF4_9RHOB|nr:TRAP transporter substrate-binding protein [Paracoccus homiensis]SET33529.1 tripartite ATP-independent transporter solute receptor, DctP family [Paracoccus homiensis]